MTLLRGAVVGLLLGLVAAGCADESTGEGAGRTSPTSTTVTEDTTTTAVPRSEREQVIAAAVVHRVRVENSFGGGDVFQQVRAIEKHVTATDTRTTGGADIDDAVRATVEASLAPTEVLWVADENSDPDLWQRPEMEGVAFLYLGEPEIDGDTAKIYTGLYCGEVCGIYSTSVLERGDDGAWTVTGNDGPVVIS